jgi:hypothetical protein
MIEILATKKRNEFIVVTFPISPHRLLKAIEKKRSSKKIRKQKNHDL